MATKPKIEVVTDNDRCARIVEQLAKYKILAVDAEGVNLGKEGPLTLLQIGTPDDEVYVFDVFVNKQLFQAGRLQHILQSQEIVKVIQSCSGDSAALFCQFGIKLQNVFDTQVAHLVIQEHKGRKLPSPVKLAEICSIYSDNAQVSENKDTLKEIWITSDGELWAKRPLTEEMIQYASGDVTALIPEVYETQKRYLESNDLLTKYNSRVVDEINYEIDASVFARVQERLDTIAECIISEFDKKYGPDIKLESITDEDDIKALNNVRLENPSLSPLVKRLKTDSIKDRLKTLRDQLSEEGDNFIPKQRSFGFLNAYQRIPDEWIQTETKDIQKTIDAIVLKGIAKKYTTDTRLAAIARYEKESLKPVRPSNKHASKYDPVVLSLHWQLQEENLKKLRDQLSEEGDNLNTESRSFGFLNAYQRHPDESIRREAKEIQKNIDRIVLKSIAKKYTRDTRLSEITQCEKESLRSIRPSSERDPKYDPVVLSFYWQSQEDDLIKTIEHFKIEQRNYSIPEGRYKWLKYARSGNVPQRMKEMAKNHLQNLDRMFGRGNCPFSR